MTDTMADYLTETMTDPQAYEERAILLGGIGFNMPDAPEEGEGPFDEAPITTLDDGLAEWVIDKMAGCNDRIARIKAQAAAMVKDAEQDLASLEWRYGTALQDWTRQKLAESKRKNARSYKTLSGTAAFRTIPGRVVVVDPDLALTTCPMALKTTVDPKRVPVIDTMDELTGEIVKSVPAGCQWIEERETFSVKSAATKGTSDEQAS